MPAMLTRTGLSLSFLTLAACSDAALPAEDFGPTFERIHAAALAPGDRSHALLADLCRKAPKRLAGSPGARDAVRWAERALSEAGCDRVWREQVEVPHWERGEREELRLVGADAAALGAPPLNVTALGGSIGTPPEGIEGEVVVAFDFDELRALGGAIDGKVVLFARPMDPTLEDTFAAYGGAVDQRGRGAVEAARLGARAVLVRSMTTRADDFPHTGAMRYVDDVERIPAAGISTRAADWLVAEAAAGRRHRVRLWLDARWFEPAVGYNVLGELTGRETSDELVLVGGHLDAWDLASGAHDDGAGCVHAVEAVRLLTELGLRPRRTLRVCLFANEENGLRGGRAYAAEHAGERHVAAIESDRGGFRPRGFTTNASAGHAARRMLEDLAAPLADWGADRIETGGGGADIGPLEEHGVVLIGLKPDSARYFDFHHAANDHPDAVHPRELALGAAAVASLAFALAETPTALPPLESAAP